MNSAQVIERLRRASLAVSERAGGDYDAAPGTPARVTWTRYNDAYVSLANRVHRPLNPFHDNRYTAEIEAWLSD